MRDHSNHKKRGDYKNSDCLDSSHTLYVQHNVRNSGTLEEGREPISFEKNFAVTALDNFGIHFEFGVADDWPNGVPNNWPNHRKGKN